METDWQPFADNRRMEACIGLSKHVHLNSKHKQKQNGSPMLTASRRKVSLLML